MVMLILYCVHYVDESLLFMLLDLFSVMFVHNDLYLLLVASGFSCLCL